MGKRKEGEIKRLKKFLKEEGKDKRGMENLEKELGGEKITRRAKKGVLARAAGFVYGTALALSLWGCVPSSYQQQSNQGRYIPLVSEVLGSKAGNKIGEGVAEGMRNMTLPSREEAERIKKDLEKKGVHVKSYHDYQKSEKAPQKIERREKGFVNSPKDIVFLPLKVLKRTYDTAKDAGLIESPDERDSKK